MPRFDLFSNFANLFLNGNRRLRLIKTTSNLYKINENPDLSLGIEGWSFLLDVLISLMVITGTEWTCLHPLWITVTWSVYQIDTGQDKFQQESFLTVLQFGGTLLFGKKLCFNCTVY